MSYWLQTKGEPIHELYTTASGLYVTWLTIRLLVLLSTWIPKGWTAVWGTVKRWSITVSLFIEMSLPPRVINPKCGDFYSNGSEMLDSLYRYLRLLWQWESL
jgi:hypothetical protein